MARTRVEVVHVGVGVPRPRPTTTRAAGGSAAASTYAALTTARLGSADGGARRGRRGRRGGRTSSTCSGTPASSCCSCRSTKGRSSTTSRRRAGACRRASQVGVPLPDRGRARGLATRRPAGRSCPVAGEMLDAWAAVDPGRCAIVAVGWQGFLRELVAGERVARRPPRPSRARRVAPTSSASAATTSPPGTSLADLLALLHPGARLLVTQGATGGLLIHVERRRPDRDAALPADRGRPGGRPDRRRRHVPRRAACIGPAPRDRRTPSGAPSPRPPVRRGRGLARRRGAGLDGVPDRAAVLVRRARERVRRAVLPAEVDQVGPVGLDNDARARHRTADGRPIGPPRDVVGAGRGAGDPPRGAARAARADAGARPVPSPRMHRAQRRLAITQAMLAQLRQLDRGDDREPARARRERLPRLDRLRRTDRAGGAGAPARRRSARSSMAWRRPRGGPRPRP